MISATLKYTLPGCKAESFACISINAKIMIVACRISGRELQQLIPQVLVGSQVKERSTDIFKLTCRIINVTIQEY